MDFDSFNSIKDDKNLKANEKYFYMLIINYARNKGYAFPSYEQLMNDMNTTDRKTISSIIKKLEKNGYIKYNKGNSSKKANEYYPLKYVTSSAIITSGENLTSSEIITSTSSENLTSTSGENLTPTKNITINKTKNILSPSESVQADKKYLEIFNHWNMEGVTQTQKLTTEIKKGIDLALKLKKDDDTNLTIEDIKSSISNYAKLYKMGLFTYQWRLVEFLKRKQRDTGVSQLLLFSDNGTTNLNLKKKLTNSTNSATNNNEFDMTGL